MENKEKIRCLYIGNFSPPFSTEQDVRKAFEHLGHEVIQVQENEIKHNLHLINNYDYDLLLITGTWADSISLSDWLDIMHECAVRNIPTATLHLDTFWGKSRGGRKWWLEPMFHTAYIFTADGDYQKEWKAFGKNHIWLPPAVRHDAAKFGTFRKEYACDVAFVGSNGVGYHNDVWNYRKELVDFLRETCKKNGWSFKNPGGDDPKISRGDDMNDFYASAKVTVGDSLCLKKEKSRYYSDRVTECLGRGGTLIMPQLDTLDETFDSELQMYPWGDFESLEIMIKGLLANDELRQKKLQVLQQEAAEKHTYVQRVEKIFEVVGLL